MKLKKSALLLVTGLAVGLTAAADGVAAEKRCMLSNGTKVVCPVQSDAALAKAQEAYENEGNAMIEGKGGSTYGVGVFDQLTGVGKIKDAEKKDKAITSGYSGSGGKTELWNRVQAPSKDVGARYNQWTNNWSPKFTKTLVPGADPNEGKQWYYSYCIACHGWTLNGDGPTAVELDPKPRILTDGSYMNNKSNLDLFKVIKGGGAAVDLSEVMPAWGNYLQDQDIWNIVAWLRAMADVKQFKTVDEYLNPKSSYTPKKGEVTPLNMAKNADFQEAQEGLEEGMAGRGVIKGGGYVEGGQRKKPKDVAGKVKSGY